MRASAETERREPTMSSRSQKRAKNEPQNEPEMNEERVRKRGNEHERQRAAKSGFLRWIRRIHQMNAGTMFRRLYLNDCRPTSF